MSIAFRFLSLFLLLMALTAGVHYIITPLYDDGSTGFPVWRAYNWAMAVAVIVAFAASACQWLRQGGSGPEGSSAASWLSTNLRFYASLVLLLWFLNNWFASLMNLDISIAWPFVNAIFVALMLSSGLHWWQAGKSRP